MTAVPIATPVPSVTAMATLIATLDDNATVNFGEHSYCNAWSESPIQVRIPCIGTLSERDGYCVLERGGGWDPSSVYATETRSCDDRPVSTTRMRRRVERDRDRSTYSRHSYAR